MIDDPNETTELPECPRWLIDDTAEIEDGRIFCCHTRYPMLIGELVPDDEISASGLQVGLGNGWTLEIVRSIDNFTISGRELAKFCEYLRSAMSDHNSIRGEK